MPKIKKQYFRVEYHYDGADDRLAWFEMFGTHKELHRALSAIMSNHHTLFDMKIENLSHIRSKKPKTHGDSGLPDVSEV